MFYEKLESSNWKCFASKTDRGGQRLNVNAKPNFCYKNQIIVIARSQQAINAVTCNYLQWSQITASLWSFSSQNFFLDFHEKLHVQFEWWHFLSVTLKANWVQRKKRYRMLDVGSIKLVLMYWIVGAEVAAFSIFPFCKKVAANSCVIAEGFLISNWLYNKKSWHFNSFSYPLSDSGPSLPFWSVIKSCSKSTRWIISALIRK